MTAQTVDAVMEFLQRCKIPGKDYLYCIKPKEFTELRTLLTASMAQWRDIADAPKDGTAFMAYSPMHGIHLNVSWNPTLQRFDPNGRSSLMSNWTHFQPLPPPPGATT